MLHNAMILAAGKGERLKPLTLHCHKSLLWLPGGPTLGRWVEALDVSTMVVNTHHLAEQIISFLQYKRYRAIVSYEHRLLDSGGAVRHALPYFDTPFWVVNSDLYADCHAMQKTLYKAWRGHEGARLLVAPKAAAHQQMGDYDMHGDGRLTYRKGGKWVATGLQIIQREAYSTWADGSVFSNRLVWQQLEQQGTLYGTPFNGVWMDIGTHERLHEAYRTSPSFERSG